MGDAMGAKIKIKSAVVFANMIFGPLGIVVFLYKVLDKEIGTIGFFINIILIFINIMIFTKLKFKEEVDEEIKKVRCQYESRIIELIKYINNSNRNDDKNADTNQEK